MSDIQKQMEAMKLTPRETGLLDDTVKKIKYQQLNTPDLPSGTNVFITYVNNPFDFVVNLEMFRKKFLELKSEMAEFYSKKVIVLIPLANSI